MGRRYQQGEPDYYINEYINRQFINDSSIKHPNTVINTNNPSNNNINNKINNTNTNNLGNLNKSDTYPVQNNMDDLENNKDIIFNMETGRTNLNINLSNLN